MEILKAIILGAVQGLTEFLPVSSSGHLVILGAILGDELGEGSTAQSVLLHLGSLLAIIFVFRADILKLLYPRIQWRLIGLLLLASIPAAFVGLTIKKALPDAEAAWIEHNVLQSPWVACVCLLVTAGLLYLAERPREAHVSFENVRGRDYWLVLVIGMMQAVALLPGISRSGSTICVALMLHWVKSDAIRLSFLMGLIAIGGAGLIEAREITEIPFAPAIGGFIASLLFSLVGLAGIKFVVHRRKLRWFAAYCAVVGSAGLTWFLFNPPG